MAYVNFANKKVMLTFVSPHTMNAWALIDTQPWRKVQPIAADGVNNMFSLLNAAKASGRLVSGSYDDATGLLYTLYLT